MGVRQTGELEAWIPTVIPTLRTRWADYLFGLPAHQPAPNFGDWLSLLHAAAATDRPKISHYLAQLLNSDTNNDENFLHDWVTLTDLFSLTFKAAQDKADQLNGAAWQNLLELQNRVLECAAQISEARRARPATDTLSRRALYLQTVTDLNQKIVTTWDPDQLLNEVIILVQQNFGYQYVHLFLLDQVRQILLLKHIVWEHKQPRPEDFITLRVGQGGLVGRAAATGQLLLVNDVLDHPDFLAHPALPHVKAQMAVPLIEGKNLVGVLDIQSNQFKAFSQDDAQIMQALADQISVAIENARLQRAIHRTMREQAILHESSDALGHHFDLDKALNLITRKVAEVMEVDACVVCQIDEANNLVTTLAEYVVHYPGTPPRTWREVKKTMRLSKDPLARQVCQTGRPVISRANSKKPSEEMIWQTPAGHTDRRATWGIVLALPLKAEKRLIGLLEVYNKSPNRTFAAEDIQLYRNLATQTALAMERARLFEETRRLSEAITILKTMAAKISADFAAPTLLDEVALSLRQAINCRSCSISLLDASGHKLEIKAADGLKPHWRDLKELNLEESAAGPAIIKKQTVYWPDTRREAGFMTLDREVRSLLAVPLIIGEQVIGAICVDDRQPHAFNQTHEQLLAVVAAQIGVVLENSRLKTEIATQQHLLEQELAQLKANSYPTRSLFEPKEVPLLDLLRRTLLRLQAEAHHKKIRLISKLPVATPGRVIGGETYLEQALAALVRSSIRLAPKNGQVSVTVLLTEDRIKIVAETDGTTLPPQAQAQIFAKGELYAAQEILNGHGGQIGFEAPAGGGNLFYAVLPLVGEQAPPRQVPS
jgi:GAF domain-containing protein